MKISLFERLASVGARPVDTSEDRTRRAGQTLTACLVSALAIGWDVIYLANGLPLAASIPMFFQVASVVGIIYFAKTKRFLPFHYTQVTLALVLPFLLQITLGGFVPSSGVMLWSSIAPFGALTFRGTEHARPWFYAFAAELVIAGLLEPHLHRPAHLDSSLVITMFVLNAYGVTLTAFLMLRYFVRGREQALAALGVEREKSERLLLNVLPAAIAERLKENEATIADAFDDVTVLFADIAGFTPLAAKLAPHDLVRILNDLFSEFDHLTDRYGLEKIKTIGDAYMVAGGLPTPRPDHADAIAHMALQMVDVVRRSHTDLNIRIGVDTGPVVAGVIGRRKFIYDLWGDTVNTASRMESHGIPGEIQVTERTYERLKDTFSFSPRGEIDVKGKGLTTTYLLTGRR